MCMSESEIMKCSTLSKSKLSKKHTCYPTRYVASRKPMMRLKEKEADVLKLK